MFQVYASPNFFFVVQKQTFVQMYPILAVSRCPSVLYCASHNFRLLQPASERIIVHVHKEIHARRLEGIANRPFLFSFLGITDLGFCCIRGS